MKKIIIVMLGLFLSLGAFSQGIKFDHLSYEETLAKASKENKLIFLDCYTSWCGPCKRLATTVFTQEKVGDFFNKHFVNIKMDMEKGEGIDLAAFYDVKSYPTLLILNAEGEEVDRLKGMTAEDILEQAEIATKKK